MSLMAKASFPPEDERSIQSLFAWHVRAILLNNDVDTILPALKDKFRDNELGSPISRGAIPPIKTMQIPVMLVHGDLGTGEKLKSLQISRSIEKTPRNRFGGSGSNLTDRTRTIRQVLTQYFIYVLSCGLEK